MNIAIAIIVAMVARAQSLTCWKCLDENLKSGVKNACTKYSVQQCPTGKDVCASLATTFYEGNRFSYKKSYKCMKAADVSSELDKCRGLKSEFENALDDLKDYACAIETCNYGLCNELIVPGTWSKNAGKYLSGYSAGNAKYDSLLKAQSECLKRSDCGGITYETASKKFTLRKGIDLKDSSSGEISWMAISSDDEVTWSKNAGKYLSGYSAGTAKYDSLLKAQSECLKRSDCGGITYETASKKFTLRKGIDLKDSSSGEISWMAISSDDEVEKRV
ncbi:uncharacterized protein LOC134824257 [Bolinopsis microptera]|uniref:uncharacterized protein LOC134824257 n=1 Tax=Bolinopsis microptera TaxID=2820187 RepID=UPI0030792EB5